MFKIIQLQLINSVALVFNFDVRIFDAMKAEPQSDYDATARRTKAGIKKIYNPKSAIKNQMVWQIQILN